MAGSSIPNLFPDSGHSPRRRRIPGSARPDFDAGHASGHAGLDLGSLPAPLQIRRFAPPARRDAPFASESLSLSARFERFFRRVVNCRCLSVDMAGLPLPALSRGGIRCHCNKYNGHSFRKWAQCWSVSGRPRIRSLVCYASDESTVTWH
jgi:hypothetical protein